MVEDLGGGDRVDHARFHHATQEGEKFKIYELFISGIFHFIYLIHLGWLGVTETT